MGRWGIGALLLALTIAVSAAAGAVEFSPCELLGPGGQGQVSARCTTVTVAENPDQPDRLIELRVALVPALALEPEPDAVVFLAGGPGQAATEAFPLLAHAFGRIRRQRAILLIDQRGTGGSQPLHCRAAESALGGFLTPALIARRLENCLKTLDADPRFYTTDTAVTDLETVREALDIPQLNLVGVSYGTRVAMHYLRRYPEQVRSMVLDGVVPNTIALGSEHAVNAQLALDLQFQRCAEEPTCADRFPDLPLRLQELLASFRGVGYQLTVPDPATGEKRSLIFDQEALAGALRLLSYAPETAALLPLLVAHSAHTQDYSRLAAQGLMIGEDLHEQISKGLELSVICSEDAPFFPEQADIEGTYMGALLINAVREQCRHWPSEPVTADFHQPLQSNVPTLLLSGELDPVTPPAYGEMVAEGLPNSLHLVAPGQGHNVLYRGCIPSLIHEFIRAGAIDQLEVSCVRSLAALPFFLSFSGPAP